MASMMFLLVLFLVVAIAVQGFGGMPGGWSFIDPRDENVVRAAKFAVATKYPNERPQFLVVMAKKQVVAGMNYDLTVEVSSVNACHVDHFQVWDRFGDLTLTLSEVILDSCGSIGLRGTSQHN